MTLFDELKSVGKVLQEAGKIEQYQQILEIQEKLLEQQRHIFDLENENRGLKEKINVKEVRVIDDTGANLGVLQTAEALRIAKEKVLKPSKSKLL